MESRHLSTQQEKEKIDHPAEKLTSYKPEAGRVFLLDLAADPPSATQVNLALETCYLAPVRTRHSMR
jgi:hypothetical protein